MKKIWASTHFLGELKNLHLLPTLQREKGDSNYEFLRWFSRFYVLVLCSDFYIRHCHSFLKISLQVKQPSQFFSEYKNCPKGVFTFQRAYLRQGYEKWPKNLFLNPYFSINEHYLRDFLFAKLEVILTKILQGFKHISQSMVNTKRDQKCLE